MKYYASNSILNFGKYNGKKLCEIWKENPAYVEWCLINLDHFVIAPETIDYLQTVRKYDLKTEAMRGILIIQEHEHWDDYEESGTYEEFAGSYAQDVEGYSDEDIYDIFDGDPEMYWNID